MATRRYRVDWELDYRFRSTNYTTADRAVAEIERRLAESSPKARAYMWDGIDRRYYTFEMEKGELIRFDGA